MLTTGKRCFFTHWTRMLDRNVEGGRKASAGRLKSCKKECLADKWCYAIDWSYECIVFWGCTPRCYLHGPMSWGNPIQVRPRCTHYRLYLCEGKPDTLSIYIE